MENAGNSPIAQLVEQMTVNHWVAGSSPARGAILLVEADLTFGSLAQSVEQLAFNQLVVGSNPTRPTMLQNS